MEDGNLLKLDYDKILQLSSLIEIYNSANLKNVVNNEVKQVIQNLINDLCHDIGIQTYALTILNFASKEIVLLKNEYFDRRSIKESNIGNFYKTNKNPLVDYLYSKLRRKQNIDEDIVNGPEYYRALFNLNMYKPKDLPDNIEQYFKNNSDYSVAKLVFYFSKAGCHFSYFRKTSTA